MKQIEFSYAWIIINKVLIEGIGTLDMAIYDIDHKGSNSGFNCWSSWWQMYIKPTSSKILYNKFDSPYMICTSRIY